MKPSVFPWSQSRAYFYASFYVYQLGAFLWSMWSIRRNTGAIRTADFFGIRNIRMYNLLNALIELVDPDANSPGSAFCRDNGIEIILLVPLILRSGDDCDAYIYRGC